MTVYDYFTSALVFVGLVCVGYFSAKKVKKSDDFLLADRKLNKIQAAFSVAASDFGGSGLIGACALCYSIGLSGAWWNWSGAPAFLLLGIFLVSKLRPLTLATASEFMEMRYNKSTRLITTVMQICALIPTLSAQYLVGAVALESLFGIPFTYGLIISVILVLTYTALGGLTSVANTDVYNFCILIGSVSIAVPLMLMEAGGIDAVMEAAPASFFSVGELGVMDPLSWIFMSLFMFGTQQVYLQRVFAAKNVGTAKFAYLFTSGAYVIYGFLVAIIGITMSILMPGLEDKNTAYSLMIGNYLPAGLAGIGLGGIFAASLSSADSTLLAGTTLFVNDVYKPYFAKNKDDKHILWISRFATILICIGGVLLAQVMENLIDIIYVGGLFYSAAVFFPLMMGVYWKRGNGTGALVGILLGLAVGVIVEFALGGKFMGIPSNMLAAGASILGLVLGSLFTAPPSQDKLKCLDIKE